MSYRDLLSRSADDFSPAPTLPEGGWRFRCAGAKYVRPKDKEKKCFANFTYIPVVPQDDVEMTDEVSERMEEIRAWTRVWVDSDSDVDKLKKRLALHGVDVAGREFDELFKEVVGEEIEAEAEHQWVDFQGNELDTPRVELKNFSSVG